MTVKMIKKIISSFYNEGVEDTCTRILYFFNTIDTYFIFSGICSFALLGVDNYSIYRILAVTIAVWTVFKIADFHPIFLIFSPVFLFLLLKGGTLSLAEIGLVFLINLGVFVLIQFVFMGIPNCIVARDATVGIRLIWNSIFTIAPTTVSLPMSTYFSTLYSLTLFARMGVTDRRGMAFWTTMLVAALIAHKFRVRSFRSPDFRPRPKKESCKRIIVLNIDGCRLDRFYEAKLPFLTSLLRKSSYFPNGLQTVYRALTNPAFASILTGTIPKIHGIKNNNLGQAIKVEALPDIVKTRLYGSMHIKHFSKPSWDTEIVSLPTHGIYKSDDIMLDALKEDLNKKDGHRLFIADISEADFLGHAYGSESRQYLEALKRADERIARFFDYLEEKGFLNDTVVIICSDHGIKRVDHSYLLFKAERFVPFIITGKPIKADNPLTFEASIMDIAPTISYLLGIRYPDNCEARVFLEAMK
ncbi:MAG: alkaline phosphatase family protein [Candidatus Omnitrophica bacterium]|nr:alkaline phosphatase family protein [Candidatus Omnitrophota bacterium]